MGNFKISYKRRGTNTVFKVSKEIRNAETPEQALADIKEKSLAYPELNDVDLEIIEIEQL